MQNVLKINNRFENILEGKVISVTGASSGLGKAIVYGLVYAGAKVVLLDINPDVEDLTKDLNNCIGFTVDITDGEKLEKIYDEVVSEFGELNGTINCAGLARLGSIGELSGKDIELANKVNINGYFVNTNEVSKKISDNGFIINISSASARSPSKNSSLYSVAKEAQCAMTRAWALDLGNRGIRVNTLLCGDLFGDEEKGITTQIWNKDYFNKKSVEKNLIKKNDPRLKDKKLNKEIRQLVVNYYTKRTALEKEVTYKNILEAILFLSGNLSSKISGESIAITSGNPLSFSK